MTYLVPRNTELKLKTVVKQVHERPNEHMTDDGYEGRFELKMPPHKTIGLG